MSNVKTKDINFNCRYVNTELFGVFDNTEYIVENLKKIYAYIDKKENGNIKLEFSKAYRIILKRARAFAGSRSYIISKRQVANLIKVHEKKGIYYVKIPYAVDYIFKAIFSVLEDYKDNGDDIPNEIVKMYGLIRRDCFYREQSFSYERLCRNNDEPLKIKLNLDLNSKKCSLGGKV